MLEGRFLQANPDEGWAKIFGHETQLTNQAQGQEAVDWWTRVHYRLRRLSPAQWRLVRHIEVSPEVGVHLLVIGQLLRFDMLPGAVESIPGGRRFEQDFIQIDGGSFQGAELSVRVLRGLSAGFALVTTNGLDGVYGVDWEWFDLHSLIRVACTQWSAIEDLSESERRLVEFAYGGETIPASVQVRRRLVEQHPWLTRQGILPEFDQPEDQHEWLMTLYSLYGRQLQIYRNDFRPLDT